MLLDYGTNTFQSIPIDAAIASGKSEQVGTGKGAPGIATLPPQLPPTIERIQGQLEIQGVTARQYLVQDPTTSSTMRLSFAEELPRPPLAIRQKLATLQRFVVEALGEGIITGHPQ